MENVIDDVFITIREINERQQIAYKIINLYNSC